MSASAHEISFPSIDGAPLPLTTFRDKVVLVVNTASKCGLTPQYDGLEKLYSDYRDRGLVVLGVPCNQFAGQEPGSEAEIKDFCETRFAVDFPLTSKVDVKGDEAHPSTNGLKARWAKPPCRSGISTRFWSARMARRFAPSGRAPSRRTPR